MTKVREPSSIVEMAEMVRMAQDHILRLPSATKDMKDMARGLLAALPECDFYEVEDGVGKAVDLMFETLFSGKDTDKITLDADCRLPSKTCAFWSPGTKIGFQSRPDPLPAMYLAHEDEEGTFVYLVSPYFATMIQGGYQIGVEGALVGPADADEQSRETHAMHTLSVAAMCSVLNQPSFTKREPAGSRQERRAAQRSGGYATGAWHKVTWNIGEEVKAKLTRDEPVRCMPLHYTRGHWRRAEEGWKNTTLRKDGLWYQWIEGFWSGHPAFGIKKSYHAPKIGSAA